MVSVSITKALFLLVTGAWHPPACYNHLKADLASLGYDCVIPQLPSMGNNTNGITWEADRDEVVSVAMPYFEQGREVILVGHSYGGVPATVATEGQGVADRAEKGLLGGFSSVIFLTAFAAPARGIDLLGMFGGEWPEWLDTGKPYIKNQITRINEKGIPLLYNDATEGEAKRIFDLLLPHSQDAFETPLTWSASDITIPKTFLICEDDIAFRAEFQEQLIESIPGMREARIAAGHSPFVGKSMQLARKLVEIVEDTV
ncbi:hypothetical protein FPOA_07848 [Fusarium poae]|uniref:AB hydrolase-1 domain-containing protein n=1 Tax=Fusarium poae TaxID=36050 RepID=A0A1B8AMG4_FUSPO|nr:hypothetical protein FPOA_07848 [Fusarium poae]